MVEKTPTETKIVKAEYIEKPFKYFMEHLDDKNKLIASIPFVRNLVEYTKGVTDPDYLNLTSLLHIKAGSEAILKSDLERIYNVIFPNEHQTFDAGNTKVIDLIFASADECLQSAECANLEIKIVLSIAIRLKAEKFMFSKIADKSEPSTNQTYKLFKRFTTDFGANPAEEDNIKLLDQVNLMTPENIHLNSFMYEPILDMSDEHLKKLYEDVSKL
jgi:hypothetical protein